VRYSNLKKKNLFLDISSTNIDTLFPSLNQCLKTSSTEIFVSVAIWKGDLRLSNALERISRPCCESLYPTNTSHRKHEICLHDYPLHCVLCSQKRTHFYYWNQHLNIRMRVCYCHEAGLCCYLVIHVENLLRELQMFHFHSWLIDTHRPITVAAESKAQTVFASSNTVNVGSNLIPGMDVFVRLFYIYVVLYVM
jgi:hypothetical protein